MRTANDQRMKTQEIEGQGETRSLDRNGSARCRLCGKTVLEIGGYLHRVNETGVTGIWECRPSCSAQMTDDDRLLAAIEGPNIERSNADGE